MEFYGNFSISCTYSASLFAKLGCRTRLPLSRGVVLAMESEVWKELGVEPVAFMPASYVEGPLHGLADGGDLDTLEGIAWHDVALFGRPRERRGR